MSLFEPIDITWKGEQKTVEPEKVMRVLAVLEDHVTFVEANRMFADAYNSGVRKQVKIATAYADFLRACGFKVTAGEVIETLDASAYMAALMEIISVLKLTLPIDERKRYEAVVSGSESPVESKGTEPKKTRATKSSRKKPTKSQ